MNKNKQFHYYNKLSYCSKCRTWIPKKDLWHINRCPICHTQTRTTTRHPHLRKPKPQITPTKTKDYNQKAYGILDFNLIKQWEEP